MGRVVRFLISGGLAAATQFSIFYVLTNLAGVWYVAAAVVAWLVSLLVSFVLQRAWTFGVSGRAGAGRHLAGFLALGLANAAINAGLLYALVDWVRVPHLLAQAFLLVAIAAWNFVVMRWLIFRERPSA